MDILTAPPTATLQPLNPVVANSAAYSFSISYSDDGSGVDLSSIDSGDVQVGNGRGTYYTTTLTSSVTQEDGSVLATYSVAAPGGSWSHLDSGQYTISLADGQVQDNAGNFAAGGALAVFNFPYTAPAPVEGSITRGARGSLRVAVEDTGSAVLPPTDTAVMYAANNAANRGAVVLGSAELGASLSLGDVTVVSLPLAMPSGLAAGTYHLFASLVPVVGHGVIFATYDVAFTVAAPRIPRSSVARPAAIAANLAASLFSTQAIAGRDDAVAAWMDGVEGLFQ